MTPDEEKLKIKPSDIKPGDVFNQWEVIKYDHTNKHRIKYFLCKCLVCGKIRPVRGTDLINGVSKACSKECCDSLLGQKIGRWTIISVDKSRKGYYNCVCDCGTRKSISKQSLKHGQTKSCGCLKKENCVKRNRETAESRVGAKIGLLTLQEPILKGKSYYYKCKCECGNEVTVSWRNLQSGNTVSCGCINSKINELMDKFLTENKIPHKREYKFLDCCDKKPLPFDFALFNNEEELIGLIENNGKQHYSTIGTKWSTSERLVYQQKHDYIKRKFCEDNGIPYLVIPYQYFNDFEKFLTTSDFWQIVIKNFND